MKKSTNTQHPQNSHNSLHERKSSKMSKIEENLKNKKNYILSKYKKHLSKLGNLTKKAPFSQFLVKDLESKDSKKKIKRDKILEDSSSKRKITSYFEHNSTYNNIKRIDGDFFIKKFQRSNILDNRKIEKILGNKDTSNKKEKNKEKKSIKKNKEISSKKIEFVNKFKLKDPYSKKNGGKKLENHSEKNNFSLDFKGINKQIEKSSGKKEHLNSTNIKSKTTKKWYSKTGEITKFLSEKKKGLIELKRTKNNNLLSKKNKNTKIVKGDSKKNFLFNNSNSKIFKSEGKRKIETEEKLNREEKSPFTKFRKIRSKISNIVEKKKFSTKNSKFFNNFDQEFSKKKPNERKLKKITSNMRREKHSQSPQALKKAIISKISLPYNPSNLANKTITNNFEISKFKKQISDFNISCNLKKKQQRKIEFIKEGEENDKNRICLDEDDNENFKRFKKRIMSLNKKIEKNDEKKAYNISKNDEKSEKSVFFSLRKEKSER